MTGYSHKSPMTLPIPITYLNSQQVRKRWSFCLGHSLAPQDGGCLVQKTVTHSMVCGHAWVVVHIQRSEDNLQESFLFLCLVRSGLEFRSSALAASTSMRCTIPPAPLHRFFLRNVFVYVYRCVTCMYICTPQGCGILAGQKRALDPLELLLVSCCVGAQNLLQE